MNNDDTGAYIDDASSRARVPAQLAGESHRLRFAHSGMYLTATGSGQKGTEIQQQLLEVAPDLQLWKLVPRDTNNNAYWIQLVSTSMLLTIRGGANSEPGDGARLILWDEDEGSKKAQQWQLLRPLGRDQYKIASVHSQEFVTCEGGATVVEPGAYVQHWKSDDGSPTAQLLTLC
jgi:hypothetical protein